MTWTSLPPLIEEKENCQAGLVIDQNGKKGILVAGGEGQASSEFLDLETLIWEPRANLPYQISNGGSVPYQNSFLIVGGYSTLLPDPFLNTIYYYNPDDDQWEQLPYTLEDRKDYPTAFMVPDDFANCL